MARKDPYADIMNGPETPGSFDLVKDYDWTSVPRNAPLRAEAPSAYITAYSMQHSQLRQFIDGYMNIFSPNNSSSSYGKSQNPGLDFYKGLYNVKKTPIARFNFPFFGDNMRSFSSEFADTFSPISQRGAQMLFGDNIQGAGQMMESLGGGAVATGRALGSLNFGGTSVADKVGKLSEKAAPFAKQFGITLNGGMQTIGAPGTFIETPKFYQYSNTDNGVQVGFTLSNTLEDDGFDKNYNFITKFIRLNRPFRTGPIGMTFPAIYNIVIPGVRYIQWASLEDFNINLLGNRRKIYKEGSGEIIVPEAYTCEFTFKSLTLEPSNFVDPISKFSDGFEGYSADRRLNENFAAQIKEDIKKEQEAKQQENYQQRQIRQIHKEKVLEVEQQNRFVPGLPNRFDSLPNVTEEEAQANVDALGIALENSPTLR